MKRALSVVIGLVILAALILSLGPSEVASLLITVNPIYFVAALLVFLVNELVATYKLSLVYHLPFKELFFSHLGGMFYTYVTPARSGYLYTAYSAARKSRSSVSEKAGYLILFQGITLVLKVALILLSLIYFSLLITRIMNLVVLSVVFILILAAAIFLTLYTQLPILVLKKIPGKIHKYVSAMQACRKALSKRLYLYFILIDLLSWLLLGLQWYFVASSLNLPIGFLTALFLQPLLTTIMFVPVSPSGLGIAEGGSALIFQFLGFSLTAGLTFLLLTRINSLTVDMFGISDLPRTKSIYGSSTK